MLLKTTTGHSIAAPRQLYTLSVSTQGHKSHSSARKSYNTLFYAPK